MLLLQIIILMVIIFAGVLFVMRYVLTKNISSATSHLDQLNAEFTRREEEAKRRQIEADRYYEEAVNKAKTESEQLKVDTDREVQESRVKILGDARNQSEQIILKAEKTKEMMTHEIRKEIEARLLERLREVIREIFPMHVQEEIHKRWVSDLLSGDLSHLASMRIPVDLKKVNILTAFPLEAIQRKEIEKKLKEQLGRDLEFKEDSDPALVGGLVVTFGSLVLDGSVANKIEQVIRERI